MLTSFNTDFERKKENVIIHLVRFGKQKLNFMYTLIDCLKIHYSYPAGFHIYPDLTDDIFHSLDKTTIFGNYYRPVH